MSEHYVSMYIINGFSLNMTNLDTGMLLFHKINPETIKDEEFCDGFTSALGHADIARIASKMIGVEIPVNRCTLELKRGDQAVVVQYKGPRLPEGATVLPEGASVEFFLITLA